MERGILGGKVFHFETVGVLNRNIAAVMTSLA